MLTIEPPFYQVRGTTVFRDSDNPDQHWVLPGAPHLVGSADASGFTLYKYRHDLTDNPALDPTKARGGGLAFFEVVAEPPSATLLQAEIAGLSGRPDAVVSPVLFRSGTVRAIIARPEDDKLIEDLVQTTTASPIAPHRATFALALSPEGATLLEQAARGGVLPVGVAYEMRFLALTPALHATVRMDYERMYDHFSAAVGITYYYVQAKFDLDLTWLVEHDLVHIDITAFTDGPDEQRQRQLVMDLVAARIQQDFFRTGIPPEPQPGAGDALGAMLGQLMGNKQVTSSSAFFVLKAALEVVRENKQFELRYDGRSAVELTHVSTGLLADLVAAGPPPAISEIDLDDPFFSVLTVTVIGNVDFDELPDVTRMIVHLAKGDARMSVEFAPGGADRGTFTVPLSDPRDDAYSYSYEFHFADDSGGAPALTSGPFTSHERALVVNPFEQYDYVRVRLVLGSIDATVVPRIHLEIRLLGANDAEIARGEAALDQAASDLTWRYHLPRGTAKRVLISTEWEDAAGVRHPGRDAELPVGTSTFVANGPFADVLKVSVVPAVDWSGGASSAQVELRYTDGEYVVATTLTFLPASGAQAQAWEVPILDATRRTYSWREAVFAPTGPVQTDWADTSDGVLVVGAAAPTTAQVQLVWVGDAAGAFGLRVDLTATTKAGERSVSTFLRAGVDADKPVTVPLDPQGRLSYRYQVRRVAADGETLVQAGEGLTALLVVRATT